MKIAVFAGTTEGRKICEYIQSKSIDFTAFTATETGAELLPENMEIHVGRLDAGEMAENLRPFDMVIDATHPYAVEVTENIKTACKMVSKKYVRILRDEERAENVIYAESVEDAVNMLKNTESRIFVSTGSKEADKYTKLENFEERVVLRILNSAEPIRKCTELGFKNIITGKGPFCIEENIRDFKDCEWLVTKSSGKAGGFEEKIQAAEQLGMKIIVIKRPEENGFTSEEVIKMIDGFRIFKPDEIEKESFRIIEEGLHGREFPEEQRDIIKRAIHTTADFDYADNLVFSENAVEIAVNALKNGADIVTDTNMALSGINKRILGSLGGQVHCFMADSDVAEEAKKRGVTRATVSMEKAAELGENVIFAIGNAPTALIAIDRLVKEGRLKPKFIIAVPVGFVNVVESKNLIINGIVPNITAKGNKGGSNVAAAIVNALLYKINR